MSASRSRSVERWASAVRLLLMIQYRSGFLQVYLAVALLSVAAVRLALPTAWTPMLVPALLLGEYGTLGLYLVAAQRYLEREERSTTLLAVTPLEPREQVAAMIAAPGLVATTAGAFVFAGTVGPDSRLALLLPPLFLTTFVAGCAGVILSSYVSAFTRFLFASIPVSALLHLPFLTYFGLTPRAAFVWLPWDAALFSFAGLARPGPGSPPGVYLAMLLELLVFSGVGLLWAERAYRSRVVERMDDEP
jgi:hypothetical protein